MFRVPWGSRGLPRAPVGSPACVCCVACVCVCVCEFICAVCVVRYVCSACVVCVCVVSCVCCVCCLSCLLSVLRVLFVQSGAINNSPAQSADPHGFIRQPSVSSQTLHS